MKDLAVLTVLFDYPDHFIPTFYNNAIKYFDKEDIHIVRVAGLVGEGASYYDKLFYYKTVCLLDYILANISGAYKHILFLDATDTNFIGDPGNITERFDLLGLDVLFGAEYGLWPESNYTHLYSQRGPQSGKRYLNSGTYIGHTDRVIYHLRDIIEKERQTGIDDQGRWTIQFLLNESISLDYNCDIFFSTLDSKADVDVSDPCNIRLVNIGACIVHDNGPFNDDTIKLVDLLNVCI